jgi:cytochrome c
MSKRFLSPSAALCVLAFTLGPISFSVSVRAEEDGDRLFRSTCGICHTIQSGQNHLGPSLAGIVGRKAGTVPGYNYSDANKNSNLVWDEAQLDH